MPFRAIHRVALNPTAAARPTHPSHGRAIAQAATPAAGRPKGALSATVGAARRLTLRRFAGSLRARGCAFRAIHRVALNPTAAARPTHPSHVRAIAQAATPAAGRPQGALSATAGAARRLTLRRFAESLRTRGCALRAILQVALNPTAAARPSHPSHGWAIAQAETQAAGSPQGAPSAIAGAARRLTLRRFAGSLRARGCAFRAIHRVALNPTAAARPTHPSHGWAIAQAATPAAGSPQGALSATAAAVTFAACRPTLRAVCGSLRRRSCWR